MGGVGLVGGQGGCEQRIEVFVKIQKKNGRVGGRGGVWSGGGGRVVGVRVDVNEELKFLEKFTKKKFGGGGGREGGSGQGGCERRIELFVKIKKKKLGGGRGVGG